VPGTGISCPADRLQGARSASSRHAEGVDRRARILVTVGVLAALIAPVVLDRDDFPLSTYPMYARTRGESVALVTAQAVDAAGTRSALTLGVIGDSDDPLIVAGELRDAVRDDRADRRCEEIARRAARWDALPAGVVRVEVVTERHDVVDHVEGEPSLLDRTIHASCGVPT